MHTPPRSTTGCTTTAQALLQAAGRTASLLTAVTDPARVASPARWTIAETAAHIVAELGTHADLAESGRLPQPRLRDGDSYRLEVAGDTATVGPASQPADCVITADPAAFLLVGYGRANPLTAALTGRIITSGRKPWLGLAFGRLFENP